MKKICCFALLTCFVLTLTWAFSAETLSRDLNENIVRLHILANSNTDFDQSLKLAVRDKLLEKAGKTDSLLRDEEILRICRETVSALGYSYPVELQRGCFYFPKKEYENLTLPAGNYNAVRVIIGQGKGDNWWCVMYPPLCLSTSLGNLTQEGMLKLQTTLNPATFSAICESEKITIKPSFKLLELWQQIKSH